MSRKRNTLAPAPMNQALVASTQASRFQLVRHLLIFQIKLTVDGLKDLVLAPVSLVAGLVGILLGGSDRMGPLLKVLRLGRAFDDYVDLYASIDRLEANAEAESKIEESALATSSE